MYLEQHSDEILPHLHLKVYDCSVTPESSGTGRKIKSGVYTISRIDHVMTNAAKRTVHKELQSNWEVNTPPPSFNCSFF